MSSLDTTLNNYYTESSLDEFLFYLWNWKVGVEWNHSASPFPWFFNFSQNSSKTGIQLKSHLCKSQITTFEKSIVGAVKVIHSLYTLWAFSLRNSVSFKQGEKVSKQEGAGKANPVDPAGTGPFPPQVRISSPSLTAAPGNHKLTTADFPQQS